METREKIKFDLYQFLKELHKESWIDENDLEDVIRLALKSNGRTLETLTDDVFVGIKSGYSFDFQKSLIRLLLDTK